MSYQGCWVSTASKIPKLFKPRTLDRISATWWWLVLVFRWFRFNVRRWGFSFLYIYIVESHCLFVITEEPWSHVTGSPWVPPSGNVKEPVVAAGLGGLLLVNMTGNKHHGIVFQHGCLPLPSFLGHGSELYRVFVKIVSTLTALLENGDHGDTRLAESLDTPTKIPFGVALFHWSRQNCLCRKQKAYK